jgi:hypothetical protein
MRLIPPEKMGIPTEVLFRIPIAGGNDLLVMISKKNADFVNSRAKTAHITPPQYLADLISRALYP